MWLQMWFFCPLSFHAVFAAPHSLLQPRIQPCVCQCQWKQGSTQKLKFTHIKKKKWINERLCVWQISEMSVTTLRDSASVSALNTITPSSTCPSLVEGYGNTELRSALRLFTRIIILGGWKAVCVCEMPCFPQETGQLRWSLVSDY